LILGCLISTYCVGQSGCTDIQATNYDAGAMENDGSCIYPVTNLALGELYILSEANPNLGENSAIEYKLDGSLYILNDGGNPPVIMQLEASTGQLLKTIDVTNATNVDWEELAESDTHLFVGDFGNNSTGSRTDLKIYIISKALLNDEDYQQVEAEVINYTYPEQGTPVDTPLDTTPWDCEAMFWSEGKLHLFIKNWEDYSTAHYELPDTAGTYEAELMSSFDCEGLITAADIQDGKVILLGYTAIGVNFMWFLWDYDDDFFDGNKRRMELGFALTNGQTEGISFSENLSGYVSSERFIFEDIINVPPKLFDFDVSDFVTAVREIKQDEIRFHPNPSKGLISQNLPYGTVLTVYDTSGVELDQLVVNSSIVDIEHLGVGVFVMRYLYEGSIHSVQVVVNE
jgi:hypothetical protein